MKVKKEYGLYAVLAFMPMGFPILFGIALYKNRKNLKNIFKKTKPL